MEASGRMLPPVHAMHSVSDVALPGFQERSRVLVSDKGMMDLHRAGTESLLVRRVSPRGGRSPWEAEIDRG